MERVTTACLLSTFSLFLLLTPIILPVSSEIIPILQTSKTISKGLVSTESVGRTLKDLLEYISISSVILPLALYSIALIVVMPSVVMTVYLVEKLHDIRDGGSSDGTSEGRKIHKNKLVSGNLEDCFRRFLCEISQFKQKTVVGRNGIGRQFSNHYPNQNPIVTGNQGCKRYVCSPFNLLNPHAVVVTKSSNRQFRQENEELNRVTALPSFLDFFFNSEDDGTNSEESEIWPFIRRMGIWPPFTASVFLLSFPITIFCVSIFLCYMVVARNDDEAEVGSRLGGIRNIKRKKDSKLGLISGRRRRTLDDECLFGIFCALEKKY